MSRRAGVAAWRPPATIPLDEFATMSQDPENIPARGWKPQAGYTLIELLVSLSIGVLILGMTLKLGMFLLEVAGKLGR